MSCGNPHEIPCTEVLDRVYGYLDGELDDMDCAKIRQHLHECGPCLREYGLEEAVKRVVQKHCGCDPAPAELRAKILVRIREVRATIEFAELRRPGPGRSDSPAEYDNCIASVILIAHSTIILTICSRRDFGPARTSGLALSCGWTITRRVRRTRFRPAGGPPHAYRR
jgi:mycothiol system anti-sigma-R factor